MSDARRPGQYQVDAPPARHAVLEVLGLRCEVLHAAFGAQRFERHYHDGFSIGVVTAGANVFDYRRRRVEVPRGALCLAEPGEVHDGGLARMAWSYLDVQLPAALLRELARDVELDGVPSFAAGGFDDPSCARELVHWLQLCLHPRHDVMACEEAAVQALTRLILRHAEGVARLRLPPDDRVARLALELLHDTPHAPVALETLAAQAGASRYRVIRAVSAATGLPPHAYHLQLRLQRARDLILVGLPIAQAAAATGFADQAHLTRAMRARAGLTPGMLRVR
ncbi:AraC family transcriptional regulator [Dyella agri]|uniref:Helix-turn-helix transcriptional regulator n=1 Tax=Dyella agri TaxID=1926869 RepID=A0ABW8KCS3_9GAMM